MQDELDVPAKRGRRAGGRAARVAKRTSPAEASAKAIAPGPIGGAYAPLSERQMEDTYEAALSLLEDIGMGQSTPEFIDLVTASGGYVDEFDRLRFPRDLVQRIVTEVATPSFTLHALDPDKGMEIGGDRVYFSTGGAGVLMLDHDTQRFRESKLRDVYDTGRLIDNLDNIDIYKDRIKMFHVKDAEFNPTGRQGVYGGYQSWVDRAGRFRSLGDGQVDFSAVFSKMAANDFDGWAVVEWECCLKHPEDGAREGAKFVSDHIIRVTERAFDDFADGGTDDAMNRKMLGIS